MFWKDTETAADAKILQDRMWGLEKTVYPNRIEWRPRGEGLYQDGEFWFDVIRKVRAQPTERLRIAEEHLPMPGAFEEAAIALRAIIRKRQECGEEFSSELLHLYSLAAIWSFYIPFAPQLQQPGYNVMARVPFAEFKAMDLTWSNLGYEKLELLKKRERRLMAAVWGEPSKHTTANALYRSVWDRYEDMLIGERRLS